MNNPVIIDEPPQMPPHMTAVRCLFLVALNRGVQIPPEKLMTLNVNDVEGSLFDLMRDSKLSGKLLTGRKWPDLMKLGNAFPIMTQQKGGNWIIVASAISPNGTSGFVSVLDPRFENQGLRLLTVEQFAENWNGTIILCKREYKVTDENQPFGLLWFLPEIFRNRGYFRDIAIAATMSNLISFTTPLLLNVLIDKVVPHRSYQTLAVVVAVFAAMLVFDGIFSYVRQKLMLLATNKIDARLMSRTFERLLHLPMHFFESRPAGIIIRNMQQSEAIRQFLTGRLFQTLLDTSALPLLIIFLLFYSPKLTFIVLGFSILIAAVIGLMVPAFRKFLQLWYLAEGERQTDLVETIHGIRAIKSLAIEPLRKIAWDNRVVMSVRRRATVGNFSAIALVLTQGLEKLMQITVIGVGTLDVFDGLMSIGSLVAFNMLSGRVSGPLVQIVSLINEYQQTALAVNMLGTIMNHPPERNSDSRGAKPAITGELEFSDVTFRYEGALTPALDNVSFRINEGQVVGIVGRSGSGKTTVTRLIQSIHTPQDGTIRLNGTDIKNIELSHLRYGIGVVLQDSVLFRGTIRDNIAAARPNASIEEVVQAARMAGAEEFIDRLPMGYETSVEEGATNFSGGQKQRLAIARALVARPRLLVFDEATSALDPESEAIIQQNLSEIARGRTMIIVSHRLSSLVRSDLILVLDRGKVVDYAPHAVLLERCDIYRHLWDQQTAHIS
jgi:ATP-binding cassette subfamily B protein